MNALGSLKRTFIFSLFIIMLVVAYTAYTTINGVFLEHSKIQQESVSPVFTLIVDEVLTPLHVAETFHKSGEFVSVLNQPDIDEIALKEKLKNLEERFDLVFFVASENLRKQYMSNGKQLDLIEGQVAWYFEALAQDRDFFADLGDVNNVHLFLDFKVYNEANEFIGIVGVGKSMEIFLAKFAAFKQQYGYEFLFVNPNNEIVLSSRQEFVPTDHTLATLDELTWYQDLNLTAGGGLSNLIIEENNENYLLSEFYLDAFEWRVVLLMPLNSRQEQLSNLFVNNLIRIVFAGAIFLGIVVFLTHYFSQKIYTQVDIDHLSQLPNRRFVERKFSRYLKEKKPLSLVVVDIDHFKSINDNYGHNIGDMVIQEVSKMLKDTVRVDDIASRWGGEEFLLVLPGASYEIAQEIAERMRDNLTKTDLNIEDQTLNITASFGVTYSQGQSELSDLVATADDALYKAKSSGRNKVIGKLPDTI